MRKGQQLFFVFLCQNTENKHAVNIFSASQRERCHCQVSYMVILVFPHCTFLLFHSFSFLFFLSVSLHSHTVLFGYISHLYIFIFFYIHLPTVSNDIEVLLISLEGVGELVLSFSILASRWEDAWLISIQSRLCSYVGSIPTHIHMYTYTHIHTTRRAVLFFGTHPYVDSS